MDAPKQQTRLKVVLLSLPARTQAVLEFFFTSTGRSSFAPVTEDSADAAIFDLDTLESRQHWLNFHDRTGRPGIALSVQPQAVDGAVWVQKPVTPAALLTAAGELHAGRWVRPAPKAAPEAPAVVTPTAAAAPVVAAPVAAPPVVAQPTLPAEAPDPSAAARSELARAMSAMPEVAPAKPAAPAIDAPPPAVPVAAVPVAAKPPAAPVAAPTPPAIEPAAAPAAPAVVAPAVAAAPTRAAPAIPAAPVASPASTTRAAAEVTPSAPAVAAASAHKPAKPAGLGGLLRRFFGGGAAAGAATPTASKSHSPTARTAPATSPVSAAPASAKATRAPEPAPVPMAPSGTSPVAATTPPSAAPIEAVLPAAMPVAAPATVPPPAAAVALPAEAPAPVPAAPMPAPAAPLDEAAAGPRDRLLGNANSAAAANDALLCGSAEDVADHLLAEDPERRYDPEVNLVSVLREAYLVGAKWQVPTQLECSAGRIVVDTTRNLVLCDFDANRLEELFKRPLGRRPKTRTLNRQEQAQVQERAPHEQGVRRLDDSLWRAGLLTAAGRLPIDLDLSRPLYLKYWPNLTRVAPIPNAARVAALWSARGASITETAQTLGIPQRHVIAFYNGALALDLVTDDGSHIRRAQRKAGRNRGLLTRLLGWLNR